MAKYGWDDLSFQVDNSDGTPVELKSYLLDIDPAEREALTEEATVAGSTAIAHLAVGLTEMKETTATFFYDDTATTGPDAICGPAALGATRSIIYTYGGSKTTTVEAIIKRSRIAPGPKNLTKLMVTFLPTGTVTEA